ncbi:hypothetical protein H5410_036739 [Solanum commersonii]|uniref:Uncharacterized protein n=1 Tax=Solanum commersonii TaxID=4109 RepID=A0A9J5Y4D3_SOLCO|nr:hypothetical protein H5410_036739 [Solanum commersonii]
MIEPDESSWHPAKDAAWDLKDCVRRLYTQAYHSWSEIPNIIHQAMFNNFNTMCTWESRYNLVIGTTFERKASARHNKLKKFNIYGIFCGKEITFIFCVRFVGNKKKKKRIILSYDKSNLG